MSRIHDVLIVGSGPAGGALATILASQGFDVLLLDKSTFPRDKTCGDALSPRAVSILEDLGLGSSISGVGWPINSIAVTSPGGLRINASIVAEGVSASPGYVVRRYVLDDLLREAAISSGSRFVDRVLVTEIDQGESGPLTVVGNRREERQLYQSRIVVLAVGANLGLLRRMRLVPRHQKLGFASRLYLERVEGLGNSIHLRFDGVPLPGYGWVFPVSDSVANVGVGVFDHKPGNHPNSIRLAQSFIQQPSLRAQLGAARLEGAPKGFPIRTDFHRSQVRRGRILLIGEAAGLVNPFTGEGIDYALESAMIASRVIHHAIEGGDFTERFLARYDRDLRGRFQKAFVLTGLMRRMYMNGHVMDALARACARWPDVTRTIVDVLLMRRDPLWAFSPRVVSKLFRSLPSAA